MDQVTLAESAAGEVLDGVYSAHVRFDQRHHLLVGGVWSYLAQPHLGRPNAHRQPRAHVAVKPRYVLDHIRGRPDPSFSPPIRHACSSLTTTRRFYPAPLADQPVTKATLT